MNMDRRILRFGTAAIVCALVARLLSGTGVASAVKAVRKSDLGAVLLYLHTGRVIRNADLPEQTQSAEDAVPTEPVTTQPAQPEVRRAVFTVEDKDLVEIKNSTGRSVDVQALLEKPLSWDLTGAEPTVLILHTHGSESYKNTEDYTESSAYRTLDENYNVVSVGDRVEALLEAAGIRVVHDRTLHDYPSYNGSYEQARKSLQAYLAEYPSICLVLDIHRDAAEDSSGSQIGHTVQTERGTAAKLMLVLGTDAGGLKHPDWQENLALAVKLQAQLEKIQAGICRPIHLRTSRFNQDLSPGMLLVEMGAAGNTRQEALVAAEYLAQAVIDLAYGTKNG